MHYWMTTHWPPNEGVDLEKHVPKGVWLPDGREEAGADIQIGDRILIYESKTGRSEIKNIKGQKVVVRPAQGKEGIVEIAEVTGDLEALGDSEPSKYTSGDDIWWRWYADTEPVTMNGFLPRLKVNEILHFEPNYPLHGFGDLHSGRKKLTERQYIELVDEFKKHPRKKDFTQSGDRKGHWAPDDQGGESEEHKKLKELVASDPSKILGEKELKTFGVEYGFSSNDRAAIILEDGEGRLIGTEIELSVISGDDVAGILQAIKYRYMVALTEGRRNFETRAFLIAHSISEKMKALCEQYDVEWFEVDPQ